MTRKLAFTLLYAAASTTVLGLVLAITRTDVSWAIGLLLLAAIAAMSRLAAGLHEDT